MKYSWTLYAADQPDEPGKLIEEWAGIALKYNKMLGLEPSSIGITGKGYSNKMTAFRKGYKKAEDKKFNGIEGISIYTESPDGRDFAFYYQALMDISYSTYSGFRIYIGTSTDLSGNDQVFNEVLLPICALLDVTYGYSYVMPPEKGPFGYGGAFVHVPAGHPLSDEERQLIFEWSYYARTMRERKGMLRDVYQENLLSAEHLNQKVEGKNLQDWILSDSTHGTLSDLAGLQYWKVDRNNLVKVRNILHENGLLVAYNVNIVPGLT